MIKPSPTPRLPTRVTKRWSLESKTCKMCAPVRLCPEFSQFKSSHLTSARTYQKSILPPKHESKSPLTPKASSTTFEDRSRVPDQESRVQLQLSLPLKSWKPMVAKQTFHPPRKSCSLTKTSLQPRYSLSILGSKATVKKKARARNR